MTTAPAPAPTPTPQDSTPTPDVNTTTALTTTLANLAQDGDTLVSVPMLAPLTQHARELRLLCFDLNLSYMTFHELLSARFTVPIMCTVYASKVARGMLWATVEGDVPRQKILSWSQFQHETNRATQTTGTVFLKNTHSVFAGTEADAFVSVWSAARVPDTTPACTFYGQDEVTPPGREYNLFGPARLNPLRNDTPGRSSWEQRMEDASPPEPFVHTHFPPYDNTIRNRDAVSPSLLSVASTTSDEEVCQWSLSSTESDSYGNCRSPLTNTDSELEMKTTSLCVPTTETPWSSPCVVPQTPPPSPLVQPLAMVDVEKQVLVQPTAWTAVLGSLSRSSRRAARRSKTQTAREPAAKTKTISLSHGTRTPNAGRQEHTATPACTPAYNTVNITNHIQKKNLPSKKRQPAQKYRIAAQGERSSTSRSVRQIDSCAVESQRQLMMENRVRLQRSFAQGTLRPQKHSHEPRCPSSAWRSANSNAHKQQQRAHGRGKEVCAMVTYLMTLDLPLVKVYVGKIRSDLKKARLDKAIPVVDLLDGKLRAATDVLRYKDTTRKTSKSAILANIQRKYTS